MTDRHAGYIVKLAEDIREDDAEAVIAALRMIKGVLDVRPVVSDYAFSMAKERVDDMWRDRLRALLKDTRDLGL